MEPTARHLLAFELRERVFLLLSSNAFLMKEHSGGLSSITELERQSSVSPVIPVSKESRFYAARLETRDHFILKLQ